MKQLILIVGLLCAVLPAGGRTLKDLFKEMPDSLLPVLTRENRLDCVDFIESGMKANVKNRFGELSSLQTLTATYAKLSLSPSSQVEMAMLEKGSDTLVCMVRTWLLPLQQSEVSFYTADWRPLEASKYITLPKAGDFVHTETGRETTDDVLRRADVPLISAVLDAATHDLVFSIRLDGDNPELKRELAPYVREKLTYHWRDGRFVR